MSKIIAIDFDGTIVRHVYPLIGDPVPHAFKYMREMQVAGARLMLWTMRSDGRTDGFDPLGEAVEFCRRRGVTFWDHNRNPEQYTWTRSNKQYAHLYIDDAALGCPLVYPPDGKKPYVDWTIAGPQALEFIRHGVPS